MNRLIIFFALAIALLTACDKNPNDHNLGAPKNVKIKVEGRTMTVTWAAVKNAQGYEIYTTSTGCGSGNKLINTKEKTATNHAGAGVYLKSDGSNGAVEIKGKRTVQITLMPAENDKTKPMASAVSAKVKALGGEVGKKEYFDSEYSSETTKPLSEGMGEM